MFDRENENRSTNSPSEEVGFAVPAVNETARKLERIAPPPRTKTNQRSVALGAVRAAKAALETLVKPNALAEKRIRQLSQLVTGLTDGYDDEQACDLRERVDRSLAQFPAWRALNVAGQEAASDCGSYLCLIGVHLLVTWQDSDKEMSKTHCDRLRSDESLREMSSAEFQSICYVSDEDSRPPWLTRYRREWPTFVHLYETDPSTWARPRDFSELVRGQVLNHAAYPRRGQREGVLTDRCLSEAQMRHALASAVQLPFTDLQDQQIAQWFTVFAGLSFEHLSTIQVSAGEGEASLHLNTTSGLLHRDLRMLAPEQPVSRLSEAEPTSMRCQVPLPRDLSLRLQKLHYASPGASTLGELIPALRAIDSHDVIYPTLSTLAPSWARLKNTAGIYLRAQGMDSLLTAVLTGDFGHTLKSKLHYCNVSAQEIQKAAEEACTLLGFAAPVSRTDRPVGLGSPLVPTRAAIVRAADFSREAVDSLRPGRNVKEICSLIDFHNKFTLAVALRICFALALRNTSEVILPRGQLAVVVEKAVGGRSGGMPVIIPLYIQKQVRLYQLHCTAMANRVLRISGGDFANWLHRGFVDSLKTCGPKMCLHSVSSTDIVRFVEKAADLPVDMGRKFFENELRRRGVPSADTDRVLRHEVVGQAAMSSTNFDSQLSWASRIRPVLDDVLLDIFGQPLVGLRGESA
jgi:hypothetical protein